jgi:hypothetical protein
MILMAVGVIQKKADRTEIPTVRRGHLKGNKNKQP